jgi:hypothetical protein
VAIISQYFKFKMQFYSMSKIGFIISQTPVANALLISVHSLIPHLIKYALFSIPYLLMKNVHRNTGRLIKIGRFDMLIILIQSRNCNQKLPAAGSTNLSNFHLRLTKMDSISFAGLYNCNNR